MSNQEFMDSEDCAAFYTVAEKLASDFLRLALNPKNLYLFYHQAFEQNQSLTWHMVSMNCFVGLSVSFEVNSG